MEEEKEVYLRRMIELCVDIYEKNVNVLKFLRKIDKGNVVYYAFPIEAKQWSREERVGHILKLDYTTLHIKYMPNLSSGKYVPWEEREATIDAENNRIESYSIRPNAIELRYSDGRVSNVRINERV